MVATTLVLIAVFVPITFLEGDIGRLFTEFALTIAAAVGFSSVVALTLAPAMASKLLKARTAEENNPVVKRVDAVFRFLRRAYMALLLRNLRHPILVTVVSSACSAAPPGSTPTSPRNSPRARIAALSSSSSAGRKARATKYIEEYMVEIERRLQPYLKSGEFSRLLVRAPRGFGNIENFNDGFVVVILDDWANRRPAATIMNEIREDLSSLPGIRAFPVMRQGSAAVPASRCSWCSAAPHTKNSPPGATSSSRRSRRTIQA